MIDCNRLQSRVFYAWKSQTQDKIDRKYFKTNASDKMSHLLKQTGKKELKRAFAIWAHTRRFDNEKLKTVHQLFMRRKHALQREGFRHWQ